MTRESKLALVVGFGLVLFVGILVADQLSAVHRPRTANLLDPLLAGDEPPARAIAELGNPERPALAMVPAGRGVPESSARASGPIDPDGLRGSGGPRDVGDPDTLVLGGGPVRLPPAPLGPTPDDVVVQRPDDGAMHPGGPAVVDPLRAAPRVHVVQRGETPYEIARRHLGSGARWKELLAANNLADPRQLREGMRLTLPAVPAAPGGASARSGALRVSLGDSGKQVRYVEYTVRAGDTLSGIARERLGGVGQWPRIYELNRDRLRSPNDVRPGTVIRVPVARSGSSVRA